MSDLEASVHSLANLKNILSAWEHIERTDFSKEILLMLLEDNDNDYRVVNDLKMWYIFVLLKMC